MLGEPDGQVHFDLLNRHHSQLFVLGLRPNIPSFLLTVNDQQYNLSCDYSLLTLERGYWEPKKAGTLAKGRKRRKAIPLCCGIIWGQRNEGHIVVICETGPYVASGFGVSWDAEAQAGGKFHQNYLGLSLEQFVVFS